MENPTQQAQQAADDIRQLARRFQPLLKAAEVLEQIGSLENAVFEAKKRQENADREAGVAIAKRDAAVLALADAEKDVQAEKDRAAKVKSDARTEADQITAKARSEAEVIVTTAKNQKSTIEAEITTKREELAQLVKDKATAEAELSSFQTKLKETKEQLASLLK